MIDDNKDYHIINTRKKCQINPLVRGNKYKQLTLITI